MVPSLQKVSFLLSTAAVLGSPLVVRRGDWWRVGAEFEVRQVGEAACGDTTSTFPYRAQAGVRTKTLVCHPGVYAISVLTLLKKPLARLQHCPLTQC